MKRSRLFLLFSLAAIACGTPATRNRLLRADDAGDGTESSGVDAGALLRDAEARADASTGGIPCEDDPQCDDSIACTFDQCDPVAKRCRNVADDTLCDDHLFCNGKEICRAGSGCAFGPATSCDDFNVRTIDQCVESSQACEHAVRDADGDGDPDDRCAPGRDCNDADPAISKNAAEICSNLKDDNCDGHVDDATCTTPRGDTCATPVPLGVGNFVVSTLATQRDYATSCGVMTAMAARDVVGQITLTQPSDLEIWANAAGTQVALALEVVCGDSASEKACAVSSDFVSTRLRARNLAAGTYSLIVATQYETSVNLHVETPGTSEVPANESCETPGLILPNTPTLVSLVGTKPDIASACAPAPVPDLTYSLHLDEAADVRVYASTILGNGTPILSLRTTRCVDRSEELRCRATTTTPLFMRALNAGDYVLSVGSSSPIDVNVLVTVAPPTSPPINQSCSEPPLLAANRETVLDLLNHEDAIKDECLPGSPNAALKFPLEIASDILLVGRVARTGIGALSLDGPECTLASRLACTASAPPMRIGRRNVPPGDYRVVMTDANGQTGTLTAFTRPALPPVTVTDSDTCERAIDIPKEGGFFTGDTAPLTAQFDVGCDAPNVPSGGAPDQVFRLVLPEKRRVILSMEGSSFTTILEVRSGNTCPGQPLKDACYVGFGSQRSFLDLSLDAGTYWVVVDGYSQEKGAWNLDVHTLR